MEFNSDEIQYRLHNPIISVENKVTMLNEVFEQLKVEENVAIIDVLKNILHEGKNIDWRLIIYINSFLFVYLQELNYLYNLLEQMESNSEISLVERNFLYWQITRILFVSPQFNTVHNQNHLRRSYAQMFNLLNQEVSDRDYWIPKEVRNKELVLVITGQFLSPLHAPTQIALDTCYTIIKEFNQKALLINTADLSRRINLPFYSAQLFNYIADYNHIDNLSYQGINIPFYQFSDESIYETEIDTVLQTVAKLKPLYIISIGGSNITADLCASFVPVVTVPCTVDIPIAESTFLVLPRKITEEDKEVISSLNQLEERIIESELSYKSKTSGNVLNRSDWNLKDEHFVIVIVGNRLKDEMTEEFLNSLNLLLINNQNIRVLLVGDFDNYSEVIIDYKGVKEQSIYMGYQQDLSAVYSISDIYLNPPRTGGGTSAAQALYMRVPVFTLPFGDVSHVVRTNYHIQKDLEQIEEYIIKWEEKGFKEKERNLAFERAKEIFDSSKVLRNIINKIINSPEFD